MEVQAVAAVIALGQVVGLVGGGREVHRGSLPWIVREVRVEHVVGLGEGATVLHVHLDGGGEHLLAEDLLALLQVVVHVHGLSTQTAGLGGSVEVGNLSAGLVTPGAGVRLPASGISQLLGVV